MICFILGNDYGSGEGKLGIMLNARSMYTYADLSKFLDNFSSEGYYVGLVYVK